MNIIVEGLDSTGKSTLIRNLQTYLYNLEKVYPTQTLYYYNFKAPADKIQRISRMHYLSGFNTLKNAYHENYTHILMDRFHLGEYVYSEKYRGYDGSYVFKDEEEYIDDLEGNTLLVLLYDKAENLISRDDGESFTIDLEEKKDEINRFLKAFEMSKLKNKIKININKKLIDDVNDAVVKEIKKLKDFN